MQWENKNLQTLQAVKSRVSVLHEKAAEKKENKNQSKQTVTSDCNCQEKSIPKFLSKHSGTCVPSSSFSEGTTVCWQFQGGTARKSSLHYHHLNINVALYLQQLINRDPVTCKMCTIHQTSNDEQTYNRKMSLSSLFWSHCTSSFTTDTQKLSRDGEDFCENQHGCLSGRVHVILNCWQNKCPIYIKRVFRESDRDCLTAGRL